VSFYLRNSTECGSLENTWCTVPHHTHHTSTQFIPVLLTHNTPFLQSCFLFFCYMRHCFLMVVEPALCDPQNLHILQTASQLNQFWMTIALYFWQCCSSILSSHSELWYSRDCEIASCTPCSLLFSLNQIGMKQSVIQIDPNHGFIVV
jgi:hypothetical protein